LKKNENKEGIRYILKFYYKKGKNATQATKKFVMFIDMQYQYAWHKADSSVFNPEILMSKMHL